MADAVAEQALAAILAELIRQGALDPEVLSQAADELDAEGATEAAQYVRAMPIQASAERTTEWTRRRRRNAMKVVDGGNGQ